MQYEQDWIMRQIKSMVRFIYSMLSRETVETEKEASQEEYLVRETLRHLLDQGRLREAEILASNRIIDAKSAAGIGIWFYDKLNDLSNEELLAGGFLREEIEEGIRRICEEYRLVDPVTLALLMDTPEEK